MIKAGGYKRTTNLNRAFVSIIFPPGEDTTTPIRSKILHANYSTHKTFRVIVPNHGTTMVGMASTEAWYYFRPIISDRNSQRCIYREVY